MEIYSSNYQLLYNTINWLSKDRGFHICIHDTSGILHSNPMLKIDAENKIHHSYFCHCAKSSAKGLKACLRCKSYSIRKAVKQKDTYVGQCYLGITEIVKPVLQNNKLICIIYLGNILIEENKDITMNRIKRMCKITGVKKDLLLESLETVKTIPYSLLEEYMEIVELLHHQILLVQSNMLLSNTRPPRLSPISTEGKHWVIESIQNYVSTYYNKDIKLPDLARLYFFNPQYLCRLFRKETGINFSEYVNRERIKNAKHLLSFTNEDIINISLQVGFNNISYFNRLFKKYTGLTPSEYRAQNRCRPADSRHL